MAADKKDNVIRAAYQMSEKSINFIDDFSEKTHTSKHKIVSKAVEFSALKKEEFFNFVFGDALKE